jgi:hypothetical protein
MKRILTLDSSNSGQHTQSLTVRPSPAASAQLLVFYHFAGAQDSDSALRLVICNDLLCRRFLRRTLDDGVRNGTFADQLLDCGRFVKAVLTNNSLPMVTYACGPWISRLLCADPLCGRFEIRNLALSGLAPFDRASYSAPLDSVDSPVFFHAHDSRSRRSELRAVFSPNVTVTIDNCTNAGLYPSAVATSQQLGVAYVGAGALRFAVFDWHQSSFSVVVVDNSSSFRYVSAALVDSLPLIAYTDELNGFEKMAHCRRWPCNDSSLFSISTIDQIGHAPNSCTSTPFCPYGVFPQLRSSLRLNGGLGALVYFNSSSPTSGALKLAQCKTASCSAASVDVLAAAPIDGFGRDASLATNDDEQLGYVSFLNYGGSDMNMSLGLAVFQFASAP